MKDSQTNPKLPTTINMINSFSLDTDKVMMKIVLAATLGQKAATVKQISVETIRLTSKIMGETVKRQVRDTCNIASQYDVQPEWTLGALNPLVADYSEDLIQGLKTEDAEYILLIFTVVTLGWEIMQQRGAELNNADIDFIENSFREFLVEHEMRAAVSKVFEIEYRRLSKEEADMKVLNNLWLLSANLLI